MSSWWEQNKANRALAKLERDLAKLKKDPKRAHWAELADRYKRVDNELIATWERRYQQLLKDPKRAHRAPACLYGNFPTDEDIDYEDNPNAVLTCAHLQPIEKALRANGHKVGIYRYIEYQPAHSIYTDAVIDFAQTQTQFKLPDFVHYQIREPEPHDAGEKLLICSLCNSLISAGSNRPFP